MQIRLEGIARRRILAGAGLIVFGATTVLAQTPDSEISVPARYATPAEGGRALHLYEAVGYLRDGGRFPVPRDSLNVGIDERARAWVTSLRRETPLGLQLDPMGELYVMAGQSAIAQQQFAARLATPNLSRADRAYTLLVAIRAFSARANDTTRMRIALEYLAQLEALPMPENALSLFEGYSQLGAGAYYDIGDGPNVIKYLSKALTLLSAMPFERRNWPEVSDRFLRLADAWSGVPQGRTKIDSVVAWLKPLTQASVAQMATDSAYKVMSRNNLRLYEEAVRRTSFLGRRAPDIAAHFWLNSPVPSTSHPASAGSKRLALNDGKIRLMEYGHKGCGACMAALPMLQRMKNALPTNVEVRFVSEAGLMWGVARCTRDEMADHLKRFYVDHKRLTFPISIWIGDAEPALDGGTTLTQSPDFTAYPVVGTPTYIITDGHGLVRHIGVGDTEQVLMRTLKYLQAEASRMTHTSGLPPMTVVQGTP